MVAARHLHHFGYALEVCYPKPTDKPLFNGLVTQCKSLGVPLVPVEKITESPVTNNYDVVLDAIFGFSFSGGAVREPFDKVLEALNPLSAPPPIVSIDIPSGWDVEKGDVEGTGLRPETLVSLTAPKESARTFKGPHHFLGGRFLPQTIAEEYGLKLPAYPGVEMCVRIPTAMSGFKMTLGAKKEEAPKPAGYYDDSSDED